jgi:hypothetical protein
MFFFSNDSFIFINLNIHCINIIHTEVEEIDDLQKEKKSLFPYLRYVTSRNTLRELLQK